MFTEHGTMVKFVHSILFIFYSSLPFILGNTKQTAMDIDRSMTDGEEYIKKFVRGDKMGDRPEYLVFTAPYKLCEGECNYSKNFVMAFPLYVGKRGRQSYKSLYDRDVKKIHSLRPNAPFRQKTKKPPYTPCATEKTNKNYLPVYVTESIGLTSNTGCPGIVPRNCRKKCSTTRTSKQDGENFTPGLTVRNIPVYPLFHPFLML